MKITVFTSNQPRHISLIERLAEVADEVYVVQECVTAFPGQVDDFYRKSDTMQEYFARVHAAEESVFGKPRFPNKKNITQLPIKMGDLNHMGLLELNEALKSDYYFVFGSSFIKDPLCEFLVDYGAFNIHMGVAPYYRGADCNFWAMYDNHPEYVGATVHKLSRGLDSGDMLFTVFSGEEYLQSAWYDPFGFTMHAVKSVQDPLITLLKLNLLEKVKTTPQNRELEIRYSRYSDFTDEVAREYLDRLPTESGGEL